MKTTFCPWHDGWRLRLTGGYVGLVLRPCGRVGLVNSVFSCITEQTRKESTPHEALRNE
jgi:hypothetical protein